MLTEIHGIKVNELGRVSLETRLLSGGMVQFSAIIKEKNGQIAHSIPLVRVEVPCEGSNYMDQAKKLAKDLMRSVVLEYLRVKHSDYRNVRTITNPQTQQMVLLGV